ncbi:MAG: tetratricopeptide repeat protein [Deltaproteobacteria bacterium]|nr:tetratricopeptide repeat protein [Deltaproteobacteria bacterium]
MAGKSRKPEVGSKKQETRSKKKSCLLPLTSCLFLLSVFCLLFTVFTGCAGRQIIITKDPLKIEEHVKLAQVYEAKGETELAVQEYKKALDQDKTNSMAYFGLGNISFKKGQYADAEDYYKKTIENTPADNPRIAMFYNNISWVYIETNKELKQAEKLTQKALDLDSARMHIYLDTLGVIYTKLKEYTKAEEALLSALQDAPDDKTVLMHINTHLVELYQLQCDKDKLREAVERLKRFATDKFNQESGK